MENKMTKKQMAEEILQSSSAKGVSETRFYKNVSKFTKEWVEKAYNMVMKSEDKSKKTLNANFVMQFLR